MTAPIRPAARPHVVRPGETYDSRRDLLCSKPLLRGWLHLVWFGLALVAGSVTLVRVPAPDRVAAGVYCLAAVGLFGASALYHRGRWGPRAHRLLQRVDHAMIFVLIGGTATPAAWTTVPDPGRTLVLALIWGATGLSLVVHLVWMRAPELLVGSTFVVLGCSGVAVLPFVFSKAGVAPFVLLLTGGLLYILGALLYHLRRPDPWPAVFGFHEVFHALVCTAATLQFVAIAGYLV